MTTVKILVVDDDEIQLTLLETFLRQFTCEISLAYDADEAVQHLVNIMYDLVITDLQMGETTGLDVVRKTKEFSLKTQVVVMTASREVEHEVAAFRSGADDYLLKPFSMLSLLERLQKNDLLIDRLIPKRSQQELYAGQKICQNNLQSVKTFY